MENCLKHKNATLTVLRLFSFFNFLESRLMSHDADPHQILMLCFIQPYLSFLVQPSSVFFSPKVRKQSVRFLLVKACSGKSNKPTPFDLMILFSLSNASVYILPHYGLLSMLSFLGPKFIPMYKARTFMNMSNS